MSIFLDLKFDSMEFGLFPYRLFIANFILQLYVQDSSSEVFLQCFNYLFMSFLES